MFDSKTIRCIRWTDLSNFYFYFHTWPSLKLLLGRLQASHRKAIGLTKSMHEFKCLNAHVKQMSWPSILLNFLPSWSGPTNCIMVVKPFCECQCDETVKPSGGLNIFTSFLCSLNMKVTIKKKKQEQFSKTFCLIFLSKLFVFVVYLDIEARLR